MSDYAGFGGLIVLVLDVWAIISIVGSRSGTGAKVLWTLLVLLMPVLGFIIWLVAGPKAKSAKV
ncbi:PLD nuclease N-terminal domain-containing protein [Sulfitobacter sabulilitoris]|uniref:PLDc_N domain-containing protein n=1 Tax=Sulfitobacter sabulilitoris TaxID=2562655 RepID=A0A5S3PAQ9_9RHOB|nr:PLD nuclease N-terminal domain-containing protein [Sulfitobacter sabulilitoris]TMM50599.1 PLDc_N domain-containing protein [Sulfitobacter sabulilitoris]